MRLIVTRPAAQAAQWVDALRREAVDAVALPLIDIAPVVDTAPLQQAWATLAARRLVFFVSPNAVAQFVVQRPAGMIWPAGVDAAASGPGTAAALHDVGVPLAQIVAPPDDAPQFDSEAVWAMLAGRGWTGASVLVVRGADGRDWLADRFSAAGALVDYVDAYRRAAPLIEAGSAAAHLLRRACAEPAAHCWLFSSGQAIDHLAALCPVLPFAQARAIGTHPRICARARAAGFGTVGTSRPALAAVVQCLQSIAP